MSVPVLLSAYRKLDTNKRYTLVKGGRGSGKSFHVAFFLMMMTFTPGEVILYTRYTMTSAEDSIIPEFEEKMEIFGMSGWFKVTKNTIVNRATGSKILFRGIKTSSGNQTAKLKGIKNLTCFVLDEAEEMVSPLSFEKIDDSIRKKGGSNRVILVFNPTDVEHWIYHEFYAAGERDDCQYINTTYLDNIVNLDQSFVRKAERKKEEDTEYYNHNYLGEFAKLKDVIFPKGYQVYKDDPEEYDLFAIGGDWGFADHPTAAIAVWMHGKHLYLRELIYDYGLVNEDIADQLEDYKKEVSVWDSSELKSVKELRLLGVNAYKANKKQGSVEISIKKLQNYTIHIHKDSKNLQSEWRRYRWAKTAAGNYVRNKNNHKVPFKEHDDGIDAVRYVILKFQGWQQAA